MQITSDEVRSDSAAQAASFRHQCGGSVPLLPSDVLRIARTARPEYLGRGVVTAPVTVRERDLRALAGIVSKDRPDVPDGKGLPLSLLAELMGQIRCDTVAFQGFDCQRQKTWFVQAIPDPDREVAQRRELRLYAV